MSFLGVSRGSACVCVCVRVCAPVRLHLIGCAVPVPFGYCQCYQLTPRGMCARSLYSILARTKFETLR